MQQQRISKFTLDEQKKYKWLVLSLCFFMSVDNFLFRFPSAPNKVFFSKIVLYDTNLFDQYKTRPFQDGTPFKIVLN